MKTLLPLKKSEKAELLNPKQKALSKEEKSNIASFIINLLVTTARTYIYIRDRDVICVHAFTYLANVDT